MMPLKVRRVEGKYGGQVAWEVVDEKGRVVGVYRRRKAALRRAGMRLGGRKAFVVKASEGEFEVYGSREKAEERLRELHPSKWVVTYTTPEGETVQKEFETRHQAEAFMKGLWAKRFSPREVKWIVTYTTAEGKTVRKEFKSREEAERFIRALKTPRIVSALDAVEAKERLKPDVRALIRVVGSAGKA